MNYPTFLKKVDQLAAKCDTDSLRLFVHEIDMIQARRINPAGFFYAKTNDLFVETGRYITHANRSTTAPRPLITASAAAGVNDLHHQIT